MKIYTKKIDGLILPKTGSDFAAGYDIIATSDPIIVGNNTKESNTWKSIDYIEYKTDLYLAPDNLNTHILIHPRSSISKYNLILANGIGLCDNDYRGQYLCRFKYIFQPEDMVFTERKFQGITVNLDKIYKKGDKIAQLVFESTINVEFELVNDLNNTKRGVGGFGSTTNVKTINNTTSTQPSLADLYNKSGGIPIKEKYLEEIKKREVI